MAKPKSLLAQLAARKRAMEKKGLKPDSSEEGKGAAAADYKNK